jgi:CubicO group peptidase (beta-lactamase class C family)
VCAPILDGSTTAMAVDEPGWDPAGAGGPGWGFGLLSGVLVDPELGHWPSHVGTLRWSGVWGNTWFIDPAAGITVVMLSNTALEGCVGGAFPQDVAESVYAGRQTARR